AVLTDMHAALAEVCARYQNSDNAEAPQQKAAADQMIQLLLDKQLAYRLKAEPDEVGVHPDNRYGVGVEWYEVHTLAGIIIRGGWSWSEVKDPIAIEIAQGAAGDEQLRFNEGLAASSEGYLAKVSAVVKILSIACSHTNQVLRCIKHKTKSHEMEFTNDDQHLSQDKVFDCCSSIRAPVAEGLTWIVIRAEVVELVPDMPSFLSESHNIGHGASRLQSKLQTLLQVHAKGKRNKQIHGDPEWNFVTRDIERTRPFLQGQVQFMTEYVQNYSGGDPPTFLTELKHYAKTLDTVRDVGSVTFHVLGAAKLTQVPEPITNMMKASLCAPDSFVRPDGVRLFTSADVMAVESGKLRESAFESVNMHRLAVQYLSDCGLTNAHLAAKLIGDFDVKMTMKVFGKQKKGRNIYGSLEEIGRDFVKDVVAKWPRARSTPAPWGVAAAEAQEEPTAAPSDFVQYDVGNGAAPILRSNVLEAKGFEVDAVVKCVRGRHEGEWVIKEIGEKVKLAPRGPVATAGPAKKRAKAMEFAVSIGQLVDDFELVKAMDTTTINVSGDAALDLLNMENALENRRAWFRVALNCAYRERISSVNVAIEFSKSSKVCKVLTKYQKGELVLIPLTPSISIGPRPTPNAIVVDDSMPDHKSIMYLMPKIILPDSDACKDGWPFIVPFWNVPTCVDTALVNMAPSSIKVPVKVRSCALNFGKSDCKTITIPTLVNTKALKEGSELFQKAPAQAALKGQARK
ncbi:unnamed protein product, partial [Prorocentrum cordatum]